jgi:hypothetical protein
MAASQKCKLWTQSWSPHTSLQMGTSSAFAMAGKTRLSAGLPDSRRWIVPAKMPAALASSYTL